MQLKHAWFLGLAAFTLTATVSAQELFDVRIFVYEAGATVDESNHEAAASYGAVFGSSVAEEAFDSLSGDQLRQLVRDQNPGQDFDGDSERIYGVLNFRGVDINLDFDQADGSRLVFTLDPEELNREVQFSGSDRRDSVERFKRFFKANEGDIISDLFRLLAARSSTDPIAGNPGSMQSQAASRDFDQGFTQKTSQVWGCGTSARHEMIMLARAGFACQQEVADANFRMPLIDVAQLDGTATDLPSDALYADYFDRIKRQRGENKASIGLQYAKISASDGRREYDSTAITLPLSYTVVFDEDPKRKLIFRLPIGMTQTEDADTLHVAFSVGYSHPLTERWSLTPSAGYSVVGSEDLGAASALASFSLTSSYALSLGSWSLNIGNMIGSYSTQKFKVGDYESDPGISNTVITNGLMFSGPNSLLANDLVMEYFINDTRYSGDELFTDNVQEIGINLGRISTQGEIITSYLKAGLSFAMASGDGDNEADVIRLSLAYKY